MVIVTMLIIAMVIHITNFIENLYIVYKKQMILEGVDTIFDPIIIGS